MMLVSSDVLWFDADDDDHEAVGNERGLPAHGVFGVLKVTANYEERG